MLKVIRNTVFTLAALGLTSVGLAWNKETAANHLPLKSQQAVLAAQLQDDDQPVFPVRVSFASNNVRLGQFQEIVVTTVPEAKLDIVTTYPDGSNDHPETRTVVADNQGKYVHRFKLDNWHELGLFTVSVVATSGSKTAHANGRFVLTTWTQGSDATSDYVYPLVP